jgi:hypothetical protein
MTDFARMERHIRYNRIARVINILCVLLMADEIFNVVAYHFPTWADIAAPVTFLAQQAAAFVERHSRMYRMDG